MNDQNEPVSNTTITTLKPDSKNRRKHNQRNIGMIRDALRDVGPARSIVIDENNVVPAGNGVVEAALKEGLSRVQVVEADGKTIIAVRRSGLSEEQKRRLALYDNRTAELAEWDIAQIAADIDAGLSFDGLFSDKELSELLAEVIDRKPAEAPDPQIERAEELRSKWNTQRGQIWEIPSATMPGRAHRLMCGDSTSEDDVRRLYAGVHPSMIWTDPPYGVSIGDKNRYLQSIKKSDRITSDIEGDQGSPDEVYATVYAAMCLLATVAEKGAVAYMAVPGGPLYLKFAQAMDDAGFTYRQQLVWVKNALVFGRSDYMYKHEPILYGWLKNGAHFFAPISNNCSVFEFPRPRSSKLHPTEKPVELVAAMIQNSSGRGAIVADAFTGSGTTMVAAEQLGRLCYGMEIAEKYVAVVLERMVAMGLNPRLVEGDGI